MTRPLDRCAAACPVPPDGPCRSGEGGRRDATPCRYVADGRAARVAWVRGEVAPNPHIGQPARVKACPHRGEALGSSCSCLHACRAGKGSVTPGQGCGLPVADDPVGEFVQAVGRRG